MTALDGVRIAVVAGVALFAGLAAWLTRLDRRS